MASRKSKLSVRPRRRRSKSHRRRNKKGGSVVQTAVVPFGILALQRLLTRKSKSKKNKKK